MNRVLIDVKYIGQDGARVYKDIVPTITARDYKDPLEILEIYDEEEMNDFRERKLGNLNGFTGGSFAGNVYDKSYLCPTITIMGGGNRQPMILEKLNENMDSGNERAES